MKIKALLSDGKKLIDRELDCYLPKKGKLAKALRYSIFAGGKRFRPVLCLATARALGRSEKKLLPFACAVEMIHTFTLVHDDLPAMDNSSLRRGKPACHKVFGEGLAILTGDALNTLAFKVIANSPKAVAELAAALMTVVAGQVEDIKADKRRLSLADLKMIHGWKTAALLKACVRGSAAICGASPSKLKALTAYAGHLGLAFQIADDILDVTSSRKKLGKPVKADIKKGFPYVVGLAKSRQLAEIEKEKAIGALSSFGRRAEVLRKIADFVVTRRT